LEHSLLSSVYDIGHLDATRSDSHLLWTRVGASCDVLSKINNLSMGPFPRSVDITLSWIVLNYVLTSVPILVVTG